MAVNAAAAIVVNAVVRVGVGVQLRALELATRVAAMPPTERADPALSGVSLFSHGAVRPGAVRHATAHSERIADPPLRSAARRMAPSGCGIGQYIGRRSGAEPARRSRCPPAGWARQDGRPAVGARGRVEVARECAGR